MNADGGRVDLTAADIPWESPVISYRSPGRAITYNELWTMTEIECVLDTLDHAEIAAWVMDLISDRAAAIETLRACMDALHTQLTANDDKEQRRPQ